MNNAALELVYSPVRILYILALRTVMLLGLDKS